jgi:predicted Abi (CAAX) family protease
VPELYVQRLVSAWRCVPTRRQWLEVGLIALVFAVTAGPLALASGIIGTSAVLSPEAMMLLVPRLLVAPALFEEALFRVLPNPHPNEAAARSARWGRALASLTGYVLVHPVVGLLFPSVRTLFTSVPFLLTTALLGAACLAGYLRTGSLWPPVAIHWLVVIAWLGLGGAGPLSLAL